MITDGISCFIKPVRVRDDFLMWVASSETGTRAPCLTLYFRAYILFMDNPCVFYYTIQAGCQS